MAGPSEVLASRTVKDLTAGSGFSFQEVGERDLKGVPEPWHIYRVIADVGTLERPATSPNLFARWP